MTFFIHLLVYQLPGSSRASTKNKELIVYWKLCSSILLTVDNLYTKYSRDFRGTPRARSMDTKLVERFFIIAETTPKQLPKAERDAFNQGDTQIQAKAQQRGQEEKAEQGGLYH
jgi:hypothetical protein